MKVTNRMIKDNPGRGGATCPVFAGLRYALGDKVRWVNCSQFIYKNKAWSLPDAACRFIENHDMADGSTGKKPERAFEFKVKI